jgi:hypothetical protein
MYMFILAIYIYISLLYYCYIMYIYICSIWLSIDYWNKQGSGLSPSFFRTADRGWSADVLTATARGALVAWSCCWSPFKITCFGFNKRATNVQQTGSVAFHGEIVEGLGSFRGNAVLLWEPKIGQGDERLATRCVHQLGFSWVISVSPLNLQESVPNWGFSPKIAGFWRENDARLWIALRMTSYLWVLKGTLVNHTSSITGIPIFYQIKSYHSCNMRMSVRSTLITKVNQWLAAQRCEAFIAWFLSQEIYKGMYSLSSRK